MRKQWLLAGATALATLIAALAVLRWLAPGLLGVPADLRMVRTSKAVPPFFDNVFRDEDYRSPEYYLPDPIIKRAKPLLEDLGARAGPHDVLGFRNWGVPNTADVITIGDSQTYGTNVALAQGWPGQLAGQWPDNPPRVYSMAVAGWGAVEYLEIFPKALHFKPRLVVVAFYSGNDALDSFLRAYSHERWEDLRPDRSLGPGDAPSVPFPPPESEWWPVEFADGLATVFAPSLRLAANRDHPAVDAGWEIMAEAARRIAAMASAAGVQLVFTIIPTKELVFAERVSREGLGAPPEYVDLVAAERRRVAALVGEIGGLAGAGYADVIAPLARAAATTAGLYPTGLNGHPLARGYEVIARAVARSLASRELEQAAAAALFSQAFSLQRAGSQQEAIEAYERLLALAPGHDQGAFNLAYELIRVGTPEALARAVELLEPLAERRPDYTEVLYRLGEAERLAGNRERSRRWFERYLEVGTAADLLERARQRLEKDLAGPSD